MIALAECLVLLVVGGGFVAGLVLVVMAVNKNAKVAAPPIQRGGLQAPPPPPPPMRVMRMFTTGLVRVIENGFEHEEALPASPLGHGDYPTAIGAAPSGDIYLVGKLYTGRPGPDDGVVYRRRGAAWEIVHTMSGKTFHSVCADATRLYVGGVGGYTVFEGGRWTFNPMPFDSVVNVWLEDGKLLAAKWDGKAAWDLSSGTAVEIAPRKAPDQDQCIVGGTRFIRSQRSQELGETTLSPEESQQMRDELAQVKRQLDQRN
jgi:hypothetical protein